MTDSLHNQLTEILRECITQFDSDIAISPAILASQAMKMMDDGGVSPVLVAYSSNMNLRQIARKLLRREFDPVYEDDSGQSEMFTGLQERYPCLRADDFVYVQRMRMTLEEREFMVSRLRKEALAKTQHADSLQAETEELKIAGHFAVDDKGAVA